jgi:Fic family protein
LLYWPEFEFDFRLDVRRLFPHILAIEAFSGAASCRVLPPQWRAQPASTRGGNETPESSQSRIDGRKEELVSRNINAPQAWVKERFPPGSAPFSLADILKMHKLVANETGVHYQAENSLRTAGVLVGRREAGGIHAGAPPERLLLLMKQYVDFINAGGLRNLPPGIHALIAHFFFTTIHPFDDGNGRVSRLVSAAILFQRGYNGHGFYALSNYFYQNDIKYHTLLHECWQKPLPFDLTAFIAFGLEGLALELQGIDNFVRVKLHRAVKLS